MEIIQESIENLTTNLIKNRKRMVADCDLVVTSYLDTHPKDRTVSREHLLLPVSLVFREDKINVHYPGTVYFEHMILRYPQKPTPFAVFGVEKKHYEQHGQDVNRVLSMVVRGKSGSLYVTDPEYSGHKPIEDIIFDRVLDSIFTIHTIQRIRDFAGSVVVNFRDVIRIHGDISNMIGWVTGDSQPNPYLALPLSMSASVRPEIGVQVKTAYMGDNRLYHVAVEPNE